MKFRASVRSVPLPRLPARERKAPKGPGEGKQASLFQLICESYKFERTSNGAGNPLGQACLFALT
jgi:hypothetical protein